MKTKWLVAQVIGLSALSSGVMAYDAETHGFITYQAFQESVLNPSNSGSVLSQLGLNRLDTPLPFHVYWNSQQPIAQPPDSYIDAALLRQPNEYERCQLQNLENVKFFDPLDPMLSGGTVAFFPIQNWLLRGALREDDLTPSGYIIAHDDCGEPEPDPNGPINRVMNHFYDPINDVALTPPLIPCSAVAPNGVCSKSVDWALGYVNSFAIPPVIETNRRNHFTYEDARQNMWFALTGQVNRPGTSPNTETAAQREIDAIDRYFGWATSFRSLGDTIHLMEDGAQPQHVRNDPHGPILTSGEQQAFEGYTNARVLHDPSKANSYVQEFFATPNSLSLPRILPGTYPVVTFSTPQRFFTTRLGTDSTNPSMVKADLRYGLMDYTNRGFFTGGTLPGVTGVDFVEPSPNIDSSYTPVPQPCVAGASLAGSVTHLTCTHLTHAVPDNVDPGYTDALPQGFTQPPLLLQSAWSQVVPGNPIPRPHNGYMVGVEEFQAQANLTIPRAIAYSAGLIDYFFRGTIDVETSNSAVLAVLNQGAVHSMNQYGYPCVGSTPSDGCAIFGFTKLRLTLHNTTPNITESGTGTVVPQSMIATTAGTPDFSNPNSGNAYLVAVARYHRNACYTPALGGLPVKVYAGTITNPSTTCAAGSVRTPYQEISVSQSVAVSAATLNSATASEVMFDFTNDPIPVNATDLFVQVVYRGPLGQEQDGIAVGALDIPEPAFIAYWNNTDYFLNSVGVWTADTSAPNIRTPITQFEACGGGKQIYQFTSTGAGDVLAYPGTSPNDNPGSARLAVLYDPYPTNPNHTVSMVGKATVSDSAQPPDISFGAKPVIAQANVEDLPAAALASPLSTCATTDPTQPACWRFDPIQQRRGLLWGSYWAPVYIDESSGSPPPDVDSVPLPAWTTTTVTPEGTILFNNTTLNNCVL
ncbi:MAG: hypothetical protein JSS28_02310 [Proteobacteria bacterium]|nr:hypothetical protein [Pseudomonadota bacterium]